MNTKEIKLPPMPLAFFDEFGNGADDRVQDYARDAVRLNMPPGWKLVPVEATDEMVKVGDQKTWVFPSRECWAAMLSAAPAAPQPAQQEPSEAERVCAEAYQVVGCLLSDLGLFETEQARKILDNLAAARRVHHDVLPWDSAKHQEQPQQEHEAIPLLARIAELEAKLAEAQKDAARLDYVATGKVTVSRDNGGFQLAWYDHNSQKLKWQNSWHETARAAIDAALAAEERAHGITED